MPWRLAEAVCGLEQAHLLDAQPILTDARPCQPIARMSPVSFAVAMTIPPKSRGSLVRSDPK